MQAFKINVGSHHQPPYRQDSNRSMDRLEKTTTIEATISNNAALNNILTTVDRFEKESSGCDF